MLYREGSEIHHEGRDLDTLIVADAKEEKAARKKGWADLHAVAEIAEEPDETADEAPEEEPEASEETAKAAAE
jgi:hypothetical protein